MKRILDFIKLVFFSTSVALVLAILIVANPVGVAAQAYTLDQTREATFARAYYYLLAHTEWPSVNRSDLSDRVQLRFCIEKDHILFSALSSIIPKYSISGKPIMVDVLRPDDDVSLMECDVIALGGNEEVNRTVIKKTIGAPILTVSSESDITAYGGISYIPLGDRLLPPKISISALTKSRLVIGASMLDLSIKSWPPKANGMPADSN